MSLQWTRAKSLALLNSSSTVTLGKWPPEHTGVYPRHSLSPKTVPRTEMGWHSVGQLSCYTVKPAFARVVSYCGKRLGNTGPGPLCIGILTQIPNGPTPSGGQGFA